MNQTVEWALGKLVLALALLFRQYVKPYMDGAFYIWEGAYYQNGAWKTVTGETFYSGTNLQVGPLNPPTNGTCIYWNPKDLNTNAFWSYRPCTETYGTTACEMPPYGKWTIPPTQWNGPM